MIKLLRRQTGESYSPIYVNSDRIQIFGPYEGNIAQQYGAKSYVEMVDGSTFDVKEDPEEILALINPPATTYRWDGRCILSSPADASERYPIFFTMDNYPNG